MNDLMDPRVAQVYEVLVEDLVVNPESALRTANRIVELLDRQAERLQGREV